MFFKEAPLNKIDTYAKKRPQAFRLRGASLKKKIRLPCDFDEIWTLYVKSAHESYATIKSINFQVFCPISPFLWNMAIFFGLFLRNRTHTVFIFRKIFAYIKEAYITLNKTCFVIFWNFIRNSIYWTSDKKCENCKFGQNWLFLRPITSRRRRKWKKQKTGSVRNSMSFILIYKRFV